MMKQIATILILLMTVHYGFSQTNPAAQNLPFSFTNQTTGTTLPTGMAAHRFGTTSGAIPTTRTLAPANGDLPNTATSTSGGWKDEGTNGVSELASSSQSAGAWVVAINTTGKTNIQIQWTIRLILQQPSWDNSVALQYRIGTTGNFIDIGTTSTYSSAGQANGHSQSYSEQLPAAAENQAVVQVRWIYWAIAGGSGSRDRIALDDISISEGGGACVAPTNQPTNLVLTPAINSMQVAFTPAAPAAGGYLTVRSQSPTLGATPVDGSTYTIGQAFGSGVVVDNAATTSFTDNGLAANTLYYYFVFAYNNVSCSGGPAYQVLNPLSGSATTQPYPPCVTPADPPSGLILTPGGTTITGSFTPELSANRYLVVYSQNAALSFTPVDGTAYTPGQVIGPDKIVAYTSSTSFVITGLNGSTTYHVFIFSANSNCTGEPYYNTTSLNGTATTTNGGPPAGYYDAVNGLTCQNLKTGLRNIITAGQLSLSYSNIDDVQMPIVDTTRSDDGLSSIIWDIYSNNPTGPEPFTFNSSQNPSGGFCGGTTPGSEGGCWNKEHTFPRSWFKLSGSSYQQPTEADLFVVRPTDSKINGNRGNIPYSTVGSTSYQFPTAGAYPGYPMPPNPVLDKIGVSNYPGVSAPSAFEPHDGVKGDIARGYFYILTRYQNELSNWVSLNGATGLSTVADGTTGGGLYPSFQLSYLQMMYAWHNLDPVDIKESNRNDLVYSQQNNRNPYVDHPEYVALVWQCTGVLPVTIIDFTAQKNSGSVFLKWYATYETRFKEYEVERSTDGSNFYKIGSVEGRNLANYSFNDDQLPESGFIYYRLKMVDIDSRYTYSKIAAVRSSGNFSSALVYPNPAREKLTIKLPHSLVEKGSMTITDLSGRIILQQPVPPGQVMIELNLGQLSAGRYFIKISDRTEVIRQSFVIIK
ncbi:MAG TPA: endonuclease [Ferruginibacter sp.]|nr:endonuclease [Ferruginibacter sp.]